MWISRRDYENLTSRIEKLEDRLADQKVYYGRHRDFFSFGQPLLPERWSECEVSQGESISTNTLLIRIAEYLGFKMEPRVKPKVTTGGGLVDPPKLWVDIHDRSPKPPDTIRIRTGNRVRNKQEKPR